MNDTEPSHADGSDEAVALLNHGIESLALLLELVSVLKTKGILTEEEVGDMGKRAEIRRVDLLEAAAPS